MVKTCHDKQFKIYKLVKYIKTKQRKYPTLSTTVF